MVVRVRRDFAEVCEFLSLPAQKENLQKLHDWLVYEIQIPPTEQVLALTNYQEGNLFSLPTQILVVTTARVAYTRKGGFTSHAILELDVQNCTSTIDGALGNYLIALRNGSSLHFRRGEAGPMQDVASAVLFAASGRGPMAGVDTPTSSLAPVTYGTPRGASAIARTSGSGGVGESGLSSLSKGYGPSVHEFSSTSYGPSVVRFLADGAGEPTRVFEISPDGLRGRLLVDGIGERGGDLVIGLDGPVRALQIETSGAWAIGNVGIDDLDALDDGLSVGEGSGVVLARRDHHPLEATSVVAFRVDSEGDILVLAHGRSTQTLLSDRGSFRGTLHVPEGTGFLVIQGADVWGVMRTD